MSNEHKKNTGEPDMIVQKFQESISKSESLEKSLNVLKQTIQAINSNIDRFEFNHETLKNSYKNLEKNSLDAFKLSQDQIHGLTSATEILGNNKSSTDQEISLFKEKINSLSDKITQNEFNLKNFPTMGHIIDLSTELNKIKATLTVFNDQSLSSIENVRNSHNQLNNLVSALASDFIKYKSMTDDLSKYNEKNSGFVSVLKEKINEGIASAYNYTDEQLKARIAAIPKTQSISIDDVRKEMNDQFEPIRLDSSNAKLRSTNNETKINLLEKKIEQLQLMINKLQLNG